MRSTRKELKALATGADYATKAAGATSVGLSALGLCGVVVSNPISLGVAGAVGAVFCCAGACSEMMSPDPETDLEHKIDDIENKLDEVIDHRHRRTGSVHSEQKSVPAGIRRTTSDPTALKNTLFCCYAGVTPKVAKAPERATMEEGETKGYEHRVR